MLLYGYAKRNLFGIRNPNKSISLRFLEAVITNLSMVLNVEGFCFAANVVKRGYRNLALDLIFLHPPPAPQTSQMQAQRRIATP